MVDLGVTNNCPLEKLNKKNFDPSAAAAGKLPPSHHLTASTEAESTEPRPFGNSAVVTEVQDLTFNLHLLLSMPPARHVLCRI